MSIRYDKLFALLKDRGHTATYWLRQQGVHAATVSKLRKNERVNTDTIERLCAVLNCQPGDIMEYVEDTQEGSDAEQAAVDAAIEQALAKLKAKREGTV